MGDTVIVNPAVVDTAESPTSAVSWPAIFAGGVAALSLSIVLFTLGAGLGLSAVSPWSDRGISSETASLAGGIYLVVVAVMSSAVGGYIAGRLRARWVGTHGDEVYFRDTAHGFLAWAVATTISVVFLSSAATAITGGAAAGAGPGAAMAGNRGAMQDRLNGYSDELLRPNFAAPATATTPSTATPSTWASRWPRRRDASGGGSHPRKVYVGSFSRGKLSQLTRRPCVAPRLLSPRRRFAARSSSRRTRWPPPRPRMYPPKRESFRFRTGQTPAASRALRSRA